MAVTDKMLLDSLMGCNDYFERTCENMLTLVKYNDTPDVITLPDVWMFVWANVINSMTMRERVSLQVERAPMYILRADSVNEIRGNVLLITYGRSLLDWFLKVDYEEEKGRRVLEEASRDK